MGLDAPPRLKREIEKPGKPGHRSLKKNRARPMDVAM